MRGAVKKLTISLVLGLFGTAPAWCESCGEMCLAEQMETHVFADEYDWGLDYYELDICPACADYWTE